MTTPQPRSGTAGPLAGLPAASVGAVGLAGTLVGLLAAGSDAALGALLATVLVVAFFVTGSLNLSAFLRALPGLAVPLALLTYAVQVVFVGLAALLISRSGALGDGIDPVWLGVGVIVLTVVWVLAHVRALAKARIPVYDVPLPEASATPAQTPHESSPQASTTPVTSTGFGAGSGVPDDAR